jgi:hypothetical protein
MAALTRGPLPSRVYWVRRVMVLGTAVLMVFAVARVLTGAGDGSPGGTPGAVQVAGTPTASDSPTPSTPSATRTKKPRKVKKPPEPVLAEPEGECDDEDIAVTPTLEEAVAGRTVLLVLELRTITSPACTWRASSNSLTVKITSGADEIWSSRQCERAIPRRDLVVRKKVSTKVGVRWSGRRSDDGCTRYTDWALPGWYHVNAAALAGEPSDLQFRLERPTREVIVKQPEREEKPGKKGDRKPDPDREQETTQR